MQICIPCKKEMQCEKNGVAVRFREDGSHVYMGDRFKCPKCGNEIIITNPDSLFDPEADHDNPDDVWMDVDGRGYENPLDK